jgi:branched-chain amino acid transport system permease protein
MAYHNRSVAPEEFGFGMLVTVLAYVVLGGRRSVLGPLVGAAILSLLPELARPLADNRLIVHGAVLMLVITYLPHGIVDSLMIAYRRRATGAARADALAKEAADGPA